MAQNESSPNPNRGPNESSRSLTGDRGFGENNTEVAFIDLGPEDRDRGACALSPSPSQPKLAHTSPSQPIRAYRSLY